ncbi:hypothetical protein [Micrococcus sp.]|uniref:hypothetical protein n=1 Tax=Micrococcus sp. TaxID=1271 RepID=UPI0026DAA16B|nr:hypothetical protein [Micrococcus sp.]MDO4239867.1 hypothetical protein [Micrococcus sp.]
MPTTATHLTLAAAAGLLALTACSAGGAAGPTTMSASGGSTSAAASASDLAGAPLGTQELAVRGITHGGAAVEVPDGTTIAVSPDAAAFQAAVSGICGQPRWGVSVTRPDLWSATGDVPQPAEGCPSDAPGQDARAGLDRLFTGEVHARTDNGTLTLTRDGVALVLAPAA